jgi:DNA-3-methyladenine glycosylase
MADPEYDVEARILASAGLHRRVLGSGPETAAPSLLGARLTSELGGTTVMVELTEVEAYDGESDPASHAFRGRTPRNQVMFGPAGFLYVYLSYGMHWCANVVTGPSGQASAVLLRAGRVVSGVKVARARRGDRISDRALARGPACLTRALGIGRSEYGTDLFGAGPVRLELGPRLDDAAIGVGPRVGVSVAADVPWRYWIAGDPTVSAYQRSLRAPGSAP